MERECRCAEEVMRYVIHGKTTAVAGATRCTKLMMPHRAVPATLLQPHVGTENLVAPGPDPLPPATTSLCIRRTVKRVWRADRSFHGTKRMECWARLVGCAVEVLSVGHHRM